MLPHGRRGPRNADINLWNDSPGREVVELVDDIVDISVQEIEEECAEEDLKELKILNYLMGKPLTEDEESDVLMSLQNTNAACIEDLLQIINEDSEPQNEEEETKKSSNDNLYRSPSPSLDIVACMRLRICSLELSPEGLDLCQSVKQNKSGQHFMIEYQPPRSTVHNFPVRLCSKRVCNNVVSFEQEKLHSCESSKPIDFTIFLKKSGSQEIILGKAFFDWTKCLLTGNSKCDVSLIVKHQTKNSVMGKLKIKVQVGDDQEIAPHKPHKEVQQPNIQPRKHDVSPESSKYSAEPEVKIVEEVKEVQKNTSPVKSPTKSVLLRSLFFATSARGFKEPKNMNLYLVLKAFWLDEDFKSTLMSTSNGVSNFNFHLTAPVLLSPYFLSRCKGNNAILEVWNASSKGNQIIGITLLPLHTFYLAYHDNLVTQALMDCKLPVVSVDNWLQVISPTSGEQVGEIMSLLAFGTEDQVTHMEQKRGLRNADKTLPLLPEITDAHGEETDTHTLNISVLKIKDLFGTKVEAECFVECQIPTVNCNGLDMKRLTTSATTCAIESIFASKLSHRIELSTESALSKFLSNQTKDYIPFEIYCRFNHPKNKRIRVAQATLPVSEIVFLEEQFSISNEPAFLSLALPVKVEESEVSRLMANSKGVLVIRLEYFCNSSKSDEEPETMTGLKKTMCTQTEVQLSDFTEPADSESGDSTQQSEQLWSTTLLSQLQKLRISKTSNSAKSEDSPKKTFRCHIQVEKALQLPYIKSSTVSSITHSEPCTYVTISNEGDVNMSPLVLYSVDPVWKWNHNVDLPTHLLLEGSENLVLKVWQLPNCGEKPSIKSNPILCFAAVQISDLKYGLPKISGWFNLVNYSGKYCGKIFISITPLENLSQLMFPTRGDPKIPLTPPLYPLDPSPPSPSPLELRQNPFTEMKSNPFFEVKPNPFIDLSTSVLESTLRKQLTDMDELSSLLKDSVSDSSRKSSPDIEEVAISLRELELRPDNSVVEIVENGDNKKESSIDSEIARLLSKFDLEAVQKIAEHLEDDLMKRNHCSKPDYVCAKISEIKGNEDSSVENEDEKKENSMNLIDTEVAQLLVKFEPESLHKIVKLLDDVLLKRNHRSKPDYVCARTARNRGAERSRQLQLKPKDFALENGDGKKDCCSEGSEEERSTDSIDSDVARLLAKFDLEALHKIVEHLDDEVMKRNHCSKPDYVCAKITEMKGTESGGDSAKKDEGALVPVIEIDQASVGSHSDSGISTTARKRHLQQ